MLKFMRNVPWSRGMVVALLSSFVLSVTFLGQPLGLSQSIQNDTNYIENDLEMAPMQMASPGYQLEPAEDYISDADFMSRSADMASNPVDVDVADDFVPAYMAVEADEADIADDLTPADMYIDGFFIGDEILYGVESVLVDEEPEVLVFGAVEYPLYISVSLLNMRAGPSTDTEAVAQLKMGDKVVCLGESEEWLQVVHNEQIGYLKTEYTSRSMVFVPVSGTMYVAADKLNLRAGPSTGEDVLVVLKKNDKLTRTGVGDGWSLVKTAGGTAGYVSTSHLTDKAPVVVQKTTEAAPKTTVAAAPKTSSSESEVDLFTRIVAMEGDSRYGYEGYLAVATVIMNRVNSSRYPNTITKVVSQSGQFSVYTSTRKPSINENARKAVKDALAGKRNLPGYVLFFAMPSAYESNVARGGVFAKLSVYEISHGHVWCYYPADRK